MPIFFIHPKEQQSKREVFLNWALIMIGFVLFFMSFLIKWQILPILANSLVAGNFVFFGTEPIVDK